MKFSFVRERCSGGPRRWRQGAAVAVLAVALLGLSAASPGFAQDDSPTDFSGYVYSSTKSFDLDHWAYGPCSDGTTIWVSDGWDELHAYTVATRASDSSKDIDLHTDNSRPGGVWCDSTTVWVPDHYDNKLYAYTLSDGSRDSSKDIDLHRSRRRWRDAWSNGTTMWVIFANGMTDSHLYAYKLDADGDGDFDTDDTSHDDYGKRDSGKDIRVRHCSCQPHGLWSNGTTMWVADVGDEKLYAYTLSDGSRDSSKDFATHSDNDDPGGLWVFGDELWVVDAWVDRIFIYEGPASEAPSDPPAAPENLAATAGTDRVELTWDASAGADSYTVLRRLEDLATYTEIGTSETNSYTDATAEVAVGYAYQVKAVNDAGSSDASEHVLAMIVPPAPAAPAGFEAGVGEGSVILSWDAPEGGYVTGYIVDRKLRDADPPQQAVLVGHVNAATTQVTDSSPQAGAAYTYGITAINAGGRSEPATVDVDFPAANDDLAAPAGLAATVSGGTVSLAWDAVDGATGYHVLRQGPGQSAHILVASPTANSHTDTTVTGANSYSYKVRAVDGDGAGAVTGAVTADVPAPRTRPPACRPPRPAPR